MSELFEALSTFISNVGFPIAAFCLMWYQNTKMTKSLDENTIAIKQMKELMEVKLNDE